MDEKFNILDKKFCKKRLWRKKTTLSNPKQNRNLGNENLNKSSNLSIVITNRPDQQKK
jgi:hypothetical protein